MSCSFRHLLSVSALALALGACGTSTTPTPLPLATDTGVFKPDIGTQGDVAKTDTDAQGADGQTDTGVDSASTDAGTPDDAVDTGTTGCTTDTDCTGQVPACAAPSCDTTTGVCGSKPMADGASCDDGTACTTDDVCTAGTCAGKTKSCDDNTACTDDSCDAVTGCVNAANTAACDDGDACTIDDACKDSACTGAAKTCNDGNPCTDDAACDKTAGCTATNNTASCDDSSACTEGDKCANGACVGGPFVACDDANSCTDDSCDIKTGCQHKAAAAGTACNDGDACTAGDACLADKCTGSVLGCDDKNLCTADSCDKITGCVNTAKDGAGCDDGNTCTSADTCKAGECVGLGQDCDDKNPCTDDGCDLQGKCTHATNVVACDDANPCTQGDLCKDSACAAGTPLPCDDKNPCTTDTCDKASGTCKFDFNTAPCDDTSKCTTDDVCGAGVCTGAPKKCDDGKPCTADTCDDTDGSCKSPNYADNTTCDDGTICTQKDACLAGACVGQKLACDDGNPCNDDSCDPVKGCTTVANTAVCDDGNACTAGDVCKSGVCQPGSAALACDDKNACSTDSCDPAKGCLHENSTAACDDGSACTTADVCKDGACGGVAKTCDDANLCTNDSCDAKTGCVFTNNAALCTDGSVCTTDDTCKGGKCVGAPGIKCDDFNACTTDTCDAKLGCVYKAIADASKCDDGNGCTVSDVCTAGKCAGQGKSCDDNNSCTTDSCANNVCSNVNNKNPCNDSNACTLVDVCDGAGKCIGGTPQKCDDGNACTDNTCDPANGGCVFKNNTLPCDDGKFCTDKDLCAAGKCVSGATKTCDDANVCTNDSCNAVTSKCVNLANTAKCEDGDLCTIGDVCSASKCVVGKPAICNDNNPCTTDTCVKATGKCSTPLIVGVGACPLYAVPTTFGIDYNDPLWFATSTSTLVKWQTDATPIAPGKLTGAASLNFNNGTSYADGNNKVAGTAIGKFQVDGTKVAGTQMTFAFFSWADVEPSNSYDFRYVEFSTDGFNTVAFSKQLDNTAHQKTWYMETIAINQFVGKQFQVRFRFDSFDGQNNGAKGWFVDEINIYAGPVVDVAIGKLYDESFSNNAAGWQFTPAVGGVTWAIDATPTPAAYPNGAGSSLNFNNGTSFAATTAVTGTAFSPVLNLEGVAVGQPITLLFKEWVDVENTPANNTYDKRYVEVSGDAYMTVPVGKQLANVASVMKGWRLNWLDLSSFAGKKVRLRFRFDSVDADKNTGAGWFIDDAQLEVRSAPAFADLITCSNASDWTTAKTGTTGAATWAVDTTGIAAFSPDCALNFNGKDAAGKYNFGCTGLSGNVAGTATSKAFAMPKTLALGAKLLFSMMYFVDAETGADFDKFTVTIKDVSNTVKPLVLSPDKSAALKTWKEFTGDVSAFVNRQVVIVFTFDSGDCVTNDGTGIGVDNVMVRSSK